MIVRPFRESAEYVAAWINDHAAPDYIHEESDILSSRYWQISEDNFWENLCGFFSVLPERHLLGLSIDAPDRLPDNAEDQALGSMRAFCKRTAECLVANDNLLTEVHSLYLYSQVAFDVATLLDALPDLKNLLVWGCDLDLSFVRHANLEWLSSDSGKPIAGLDMASLPALRGMEFDEISPAFMDALSHAKLPNLNHFGVIGLDGMSLPDILNHDAFPKNLSSFYLDACFTDTDESELLEWLQGMKLKHLCIRDQLEDFEQLYSAQYLAGIEHLGILDAPEELDDEFAGSVTEILCRPEFPRHLKSLDLHGVRLGDEHVERLLALSWFDQLQYLNITHNNILSEETVAKISALRTNGCTVIGVQ